MAYGQNGVFDNSMSLHSGYKTALQDSFLDYCRILREIVIESKDILH